jgi:inhibitor of cysteine peptidase
MADTSASAVLLVALVAGVAIGGGAVLVTDVGGGDEASSSTDPFGDGDASAVETFDSEAEYREYLQRGSSRYGAHFYNDVVVDQPDVATDDAGTVERGGDGAADGGATDGGGGGGDAGGDAPRTSDTNVQVQGVDEPDLVKTDGEWVYYAGQDHQFGSESQRTQVLDANDVAAPNRTGAIPAGGQLLLSGDTLVAIESDTLYGFDVSDPESPEEEWRVPLNHSVQTARLSDGAVYLVLRDRAAASGPCPIEPLGDDRAAIPCTEIYHPGGGAGGDTTYTALSLDPASGEVQDRVSFVGSARNTVVYVSQGSIYLTFEDSPTRAERRLAFFQGPGSDHLDDQAQERLEEIASYDLSPRAAGIEIETTIRRRVQRLPPGEREAAWQAIREDYETWVSENKRELVRTGIVRVGIDGTSLAVQETGEVPGRVHDQFSLSERDGHLHVATSITPTGGQWENDLYTLDSSLEVEDAVTGMGTDQRIYSVRYVDDRAYLVTFRQVDPLHVIDISDPTDLELQGELQLPGYSDYLHPIGDDQLLGIGEEDGRVKATLFDVSDPEDPVVADDVHLDDHWTAVSDSHHAFLIDQRHGVFFLPGTDGGHVVDYENGSLDRVTTVETDGPALRARYIGDHLYVFGPEEVVVVDETTWEETERIDLG